MKNMKLALLSIFALSAHMYAETPVKPEVKNLDEQFKDFMAQLKKTVENTTKPLLKKQEKLEEDSRKIHMQKHAAIGCEIAVASTKKMLDVIKKENPNNPIKLLVLNNLEKDTANVIADLKTELNNPTFKYDTKQLISTIKTLEKTLKECSDLKANIYLSPEEQALFEELNISRYDSHNW